MPVIHSLQPTFAGGELAPSLHARVDVQKYSTGAKRLRNFIVHPHGGVSNRPGTKFVAEAKYADKTCRLVGFEFSLTQSYIIEFGDYYCRFYTNGGQIVVSSADAWLTATAYVVGDFVNNGGTIYYCIVAHTSGTFATDLAASKWVAQTIYEVPSSYAAADIEDLKFAQSADTLYIAHPDYPPAKLVRYDHTDWRFSDITFENGPFMPTNPGGITMTPSDVTGTGKTLTASAAHFNANHVGALYQLTHAQASKISSTSHGANGSGTAIRGLGTWRLITHGTWAGTIKVERSFDNSTWELVRAFTSNSDFNANTFAADDTEGRAAYYRTTMASYASGTCYADLTLDACSVTGIVQVTGYTDSTHATISILKPLGDTTATDDWLEGSWSNSAGYPAAVAFFQDRLAFASTETEPQTTWLSKTGQYVDFGVSDPLSDDDSISVALPSRKLNSIRSLAQLGELVALTSASEASIGAGGGEPVTPTTVRQKFHGYRGANGVDPIVIGNRIIYAQPQGSIVRDLGFDFSSDSYTGDDLSLLSNHLFSGYEITDMAYQQEPDSLIWMVRSDGKMLSLTYLREQEVLAWTWHDTEGTFESVAAIPADGYDEVWLVVLRDSVRYVERMAQRMPTQEPEDQFFVDCGISYDGSPASTITGLDHLEGKTVAILADGKAVPQQTVSSGEITLSEEASVVHVGLPYFADLQTLKVEHSLSNGTMQSQKVRAATVTVRVLNSRGGQLGSDEDHLVDIDTRLLHDIENPDGLLTGDFKHTLGANWANRGQVFYRQNKPLPVTILGVMPDLAVGG